MKFKIGQSNPNTIAIELWADNFVLICADDKGVIKTPNKVKAISPIATKVNSDS